MWAFGCIRFFMRRVAQAIVLTLFLLPTAIGQGIQLTPQQQQMLDSLPPAQRQQALAAIQQFQAEQTTGSPTTSINEIDDASFQSLLDPIVEEPDEDEELRAGELSRVVIHFEPSEELSDEELLEIEEDPILEKLVGSHLFVLDGAGVLRLPGECRVLPQRLA